MLNAKISHLLAIFENEKDNFEVFDLEYLTFKSKRGFKVIFYEDGEKENKSWYADLPEMKNIADCLPVRFQKGWSMYQLLKSNNSKKYVNVYLDKIASEATKGTVYIGDNLRGGACDCDCGCCTFDPGDCCSDCKCTSCDSCKCLIM